MNKTIKPHAWIIQFLEWFCPAELYEGIEGDLMEDFYQDVKQYGLTKANRKLTLKVLSFLRPGILLRNRIYINILNIGMLWNYLIISFRNIRKYGLFSIINIAGMAVSLTICLLIFLFVRDELSYDRFHQDGDRTFRVYNERIVNSGSVSFLPIVPYPFATYMEKDFPEILSTLRLADTYGEILFEVSGKKMLESHGIYAEPSVFNMLDLDVISGNSEKALSEPNTIALSQTLSLKYFGNKISLGEQIRISGQDYTVTAVFRDPPVHFHLDIHFICSLASWTNYWSTAQTENWQYQQYFTYIKLRPGTDPKKLESKFQPFVEKYAYPTIKPKGFAYVPHLQNIRDIYLHSSDFEWEIARRGNAQVVHILGATSIFILLITCLNFVNLSTARSFRRMKEVGIRKVIGARRNQLFIQFITESIMIVLTGMMFAIILTIFLLPIINQFTGKELHFPMTIVFGFKFL